MTVAAVPDEPARWGPRVLTVAGWAGAAAFATAVMGWYPLLTMPGPRIGVVLAIYALSFVVAMLVVGGIISFVHLVEIRLFLPRLSVSTPRANAFSLHLQASMVTWGLAGAVVLTGQYPLVRLGMIAAAPLVIEYFNRGNGDDSIWNLLSKTSFGLWLSSTVVLVIWEWWTFIPVSVGAFLVDWLGRALISEGRYRRAVAVRLGSTTVIAVAAAAAWMALPS